MEERVAASGTGARAASVTEIPVSHRDLLERPLIAALTTLLPDGQPQTQPVWFSFEDPYIVVNTMRGFRKERNMRRDPRVTILLVDPGPGVHWIEVRGRVELTASGARDHLDALAERYMGVGRYFGELVPLAFAETEAPIVGRIQPVRIVTDLEAEARTRRVHRSVDARIARQPTTGPRARIPADHRDLLARPLRTMLSTLMPHGEPQTQPVWCGYDGADVTVNTTRERQKGRNLLADPRATVLVIDPADTARWIEVRGEVSISEAGAQEHLDRLARAYTGARLYYGGVVPAGRRDRETRIVCRIHPRHVVCDAIHR